MRRRFGNTRAKLVYGIYFITMLFAGPTAIEIADSIVLGNLNNEIFQLMNSMASVTVSVFFGGEGVKNRGEGGRSYWLKFHSKNGSFTYM